MESLAPNIFVNDMNATLAFYKQLGFKTVMTVPDPDPDSYRDNGEGDFDWVMMMKEGVTFMFQTYASLGEVLPEIHRVNGGSLLFYIKLKGIRAFHDKIKDKARVIVELNKTFYGATEFSIVDNNGYVLTFAEDEG